MKLRDKYLANKGVRCPFCGSDDLQVGDTDTQDDAICRPVVCGGCGKRWTDVYMLTDVAFDSDSEGTGGIESQEI